MSIVLPSGIIHGIFMLISERCGRSLQSRWPLAGLCIGILAFIIWLLAGFGFLFALTIFVAIRICLDYVLVINFVLAQRERYVLG